MKAKLNNHIFLRIAVVLLIITLLSFCLNSGIFARYTSKDSSNDSAVVASFSVEPGESYTIPAIQFGNMAPGESQEYQFTLSSSSDVSVKCLVNLKATANLPLKYSVNGLDVVANDNISTEILTLAPHQGEVTVTLSILWNESDNQISYLSEIDAVRLTIIAEQVD